MLKEWHYPVDAFDWLPVASFSSAIFMASWGILNLPFLVISEIMPQNFKEFGATLCISIIWISSFSTVKFFPFLIDLIQLHASLFLFSGFCLAGTVFILVFLPETKGKSYDEIQKLLR